MSAIIENSECCICMDTINNTTNNCITPCGHKFCFQCLAKALEKNNTCPCCRAVLMEETENNDEAEIWSEYTDEEDNTELYSDNALTSFRMFNQRNNGENIEQEPDENNETITVSDITTEENDETMATVEEIMDKLQSRGITMLDLVAMLSGRKSKNTEKHNDRFIDALDVILDRAITDCDDEARERYERTVQ